MRVLLLMAAAVLSLATSAIPRAPTAAEVATARQACYALPPAELARRVIAILKGHSVKAELVDGAIVSEWAANGSGSERLTIHVIDEPSCSRLEIDLEVKSFDGQSTPAMREDRLGRNYDALYRQLTSADGDVPAAATVPPGAAPR